MTIHIRERTDTPPPPPRRHAPAFHKFIIESQRAEAVLARLHAIIDGKPPKTCALTILAAIEAGLLSQPTFSSLHSEFPEIGVRTNYAYYLQRSGNYSKEIAAIGKNL